MSIKTDPRVKRSRQLLKQALLDLMSEKHDFNDITVGDITERAEVNRATFYAHFEDKYALMNYTVREEFQAALAKKMPANLHNFEDLLRPLMLTTCEFLESFIRHCFRPGQNNDFVVMQVQKCVQEVLQKRSHCEESHLASIIFSWSFFGTALQWAHGEIKVTAEELTEQVLNVMSQRDFAKP